VHVPFYPFNSYSHFILYHIQCLTPRSLLPLLPHVFLYLKFNPHKTKSGSDGTLCSHHLPLRSFFSSKIILPFFYQNSPKTQLFFSSFIK
jgi:hypothetical protein